VSSSQPDTAAVQVMPLKRVDTGCESRRYQPEGGVVPNAFAQLRGGAAGRASRLPEVNHTTTGLVQPLTDAGLDTGLGVRRSIASNCSSSRQLIPTLRGQRS
jgi:hypothetical protein